MPEQYLIIGGSTKCGTTSVFNYFEYHPEVCPCRMKESRYFLTAEYVIHAAGRRNHEEGFHELFLSCTPNKTGIEATPDYLYSNEAAERIHSELQDVRIAFILRDPIDRLISWYRFARMNGLIVKSMTFDDYINAQKKQAASGVPQHMRALEQGNYAKYLESYIQIFGSDRIGIFFYEHLASDAKKFCMDLCNFSKLDPEYFARYDFRIFNKSADTRSISLHRLYRKFKRTVRPATRQLPGRLRKNIKLAGHHLETSILQFNASETAQPVKMSAETKQFLVAYYAPAIERLKQFYKLPIPWESN